MLILLIQTPYSQAASKETEHDTAEHETKQLSVRAEEEFLKKDLSGALFAKCIPNDIESFLCVFLGNEPSELHRLRKNKESIKQLNYIVNAWAKIVKNNLLESEETILTASLNPDCAKLEANLIDLLASVKNDEKDNLNSVSFANVAKNRKSHGKQGRFVSKSKIGLAIFYLLTSLKTTQNLEGLDSQLNTTSFFFSKSDRFVETKFHLMENLASYESEGFCENDFDSVIQLYASVASSPETNTLELNEGSRGSFFVCPIHYL